MGLEPGDLPPKHRLKARKAISYIVPLLKTWYIWHPITRDHGYNVSSGDLEVVSCGPVRSTHRVPQQVNRNRGIPDQR